MAVSNLQVNIAANPSGLTSALGSVGSALGGFASRLTSGFAGVNGAISAASSLMQGNFVGAVGQATSSVLDFGQQAVSSAAGFQQSMLKNEALAGLSGDAFQSMSNQILALAPQIGQAPKQLADGLYNVLSAGVPASDAMMVLKDSAEAAATGMTDTQTITDGLTSAMNAMSIPFSQTNNVMADLTATVSGGKMTWQNLASSIGMLAVTAHEAGISLQDSTAGLATMTDSGMSAQRAGMDLDFLMRDLGMNVDKVAKSAKGMGLSFDENKFKSMDLMQKLQYLQQITHGNASEMQKLTGGAVGMAAAQAILTNHGQLYASILGKINTAYKQGTMTQASFKTTQQGLNQQLAQLSAAWQSLLVVVGSAVLPVLTQLVSGITPIIVALTDWLTKSNDLGPALQILSSIVRAVLSPAFNAVSMLTHGLIDLFTAIAGIAAETASPSFHQFGTTVATVLNPAMSNLQSLFQITMQQLPSLTGLTTIQQQAFGSLSGVTTVLGQAFGNTLVGGINLADAGMNAFAAFVDGPMTVAQQALVDHLGQVSQSFGNTLVAGIRLADAELQRFTGFVGSAVLPALAQMGQAAAKAFAGLGNLKMPSLGGIAAGGLNLGKMLFGDVSKLAPVIAQMLSQALSQVVGQLMGKLAAIFAPLWNALNSVLAPIFNVLLAGWKQVVTLWNAATAPIVSAWNQIMAALHPFVAFWQSYIAPIFAHWAATAAPLLKKFGGEVGGIFNDMMTQIRPILATLGPWFQNTLMPAIKSVLPSIQKFGDAFMQYAFPVITEILRVISSLVVLLVSIVVPLFENVAPRAVKLFGAALDGATKVLNFMKPYVLQALAAVNQFVQWLVTNAKPTIDSIFKWLDGVVAGFVAGWQHYWPEITLVAEGAWAVITGSIRGAWLIITGIIKIALDLIQGNWSAAWNDLISTLQGLGEVLLQIVGGLFNIFAGLVAAGLLSIVDYFIKTGSDIAHVWQQAWNTLVQGAQAAWQLFWQGLNQFFGGLPAKMVALGQNIIDGLINGIRNTLVQGAPGAWQLFWQGLNQFFGGLPAKMVALGQNIIDGLINGIKSMAGLVADALHGLIANSGFGSIAATLHIPGFASGVQNFAGGLALVGENGPELLQLPPGSSVYPSGTSSSSSMLSGGSGGGSQTLVLAIDGREFASAIVPHVGAAQYRYVQLRTGVRG